MAALSSKLALLRLAGMLVDRIDKWLKGKSAKIRKPAKTTTPLSRSDTVQAGQKPDSSRNIEFGRRPVQSVVVPVPKTMTGPEGTADNALSAAHLRRRLRDPQSLRQAIVINEILSKPLALRRQGRL